MKYNGNIYRPPIEANTFHLPITEGCSHNSCVFCKYCYGSKYSEDRFPGCATLLDRVKASIGANPDKERKE